MTGLKLLLAVLLMLALGLSGGLALLAALEPPRPTLVDPIYMPEPRKTEPRQKNSAEPKKRAPASSPPPAPPAPAPASDPGDGGAAPAPPAAPAPAGDDADDGDDGDDDGAETDD